MKALEIPQYSGERYATIDQARLYFKVSRTTLMRWAKQADAVVGANRIKRINVEKLNAALEAGSIK